MKDIRSLWYPSPGPLSRATLSRWEREFDRLFQTCQVPASLAIESAFQ